MLILSQCRRRIINMDQIAGVVTYACDIMAYSGADDVDAFLLGSYKTEDRCKQILKEIMDMPETYVMPEE